MRVVCVKCGEFITDATFKPDPNIPGRSILSVFHHGEVDRMHFDREWVVRNPDFWAMITSGMTIGEAFKEQKDYEKADAPK